MMGVVADDLTGAHDVGALFASRGHRVVVAADLAALADPVRLPEPDVLVVNTSSRPDPPHQARAKVRQATEALGQAGARHFYKKTCSVLRGPVGAELDGMLDQLRATGVPIRVCPLVAAFPKNGRTTREGIHYVHGQPLDQSPFRHDPLHPTREANLIRLLRAQTRRPVTLIPLVVVRQGADAIAGALAACQRPEGAYAVLDAETQADLAAIAAAVKELPMLAGSSALAEELPGPARPRPVPYRLPSRPLPRGPLVVAGSLTPETRGQLAYARQRGLAEVVIDAQAVLGRPELVPRLVTAWADVAGRVLLAGGAVAVRTPHEPADVARVWETAAALGVPRLAAARRLSDVLAQVARAVVAQVGPVPLVLMGGETAGAVATALGLRASLILSQVEPGIPACMGVEPPHQLLVFKAGGFGSPDFLDRAAAALAQWQASLAGPRG